MKKSILTFLLFVMFVAFGNNASGQVVDSAVTLSKAIEGTEAPAEITQLLTIITVEYYSVDSTLHSGQIVVAKDLADDVREIFTYIKAIKYPVSMVVPIKFDMPNGMTTMAHLNNSYCFHYRTMISSKSKLSAHSTGRAIDFNPFDNPYISGTGNIIPKGAKYDTKDPRTLTANHPLVLKMKSLGWIWGGDWTSSKDYMHFEKGE